MTRIQNRFLDSDNKRKCLRVYPGHNASVIMRNMGEGVKNKTTYINEMTLPFPSWSFVVNHLIEIMPKGFCPEGSIDDLHYLLKNIWDKEKDLLHITFDPDYSMTFTHSNGGASTYAPWYWLYSEEKDIAYSPHIRRDINGKRCKGSKYD